MAAQQAVSLHDLKAQYAAIKDEVRAAMDRVLESQHFILGPEVEALEREVAACSQCAFGVGVSSGTDALPVALMRGQIENDWLDWKAAQEMLESWLGVRREVAEWHLCLVVVKGLAKFSQITGSESLSERPGT
jgi:hypothetical protein